MPIDRARVTIIARRLALGATLGALSFVAAEELGVPHAVHLGGYRLLAPATAVSALLSLTRARVVMWTVAAMLAVLVLAVAYTPLVAGPARAKIRADPAARVDAIVILASGVTRDTVVTPDAVDRILSAFAAARDTTFTGGYRVPVVMTPVTFYGVSSVPDQRRLLSMLRAHGPVFLTPTVYSTHDEATQVRSLAATQRWRRVAIVTSPLHTSRACAAFERTGLAVTCVPARTRELSLQFRTPRDRLTGFRWWLYETAGATYYRLRRWI